jgi:transcriptional regulator with PAS, ATPase and Fis domain
LIGKSTVIRSVLLSVESGVRKELVAHQIHALSRRRHGPFIAINCAARPASLFVRLGSEAPRATHADGFSAPR